MSSVFNQFFYYTCSAQINTVMKRLFYNNKTNTALQSAVSSQQSAVSSQQSAVSSQQSAVSSVFG
jgi:hypothetical protein